MTEQHPFEKAVTDGDYESAVRLLLDGTYGRAARLRAKGGPFETVTADASIAALDRLLKAFHGPLQNRNSGFELIYRAIEFGYLSHSALNVETGNLEKLCRSVAKSSLDAERMKADNPNQSEWNLPAFAARAAIRHYNPKAGPAEINAKVFRYVHDLGMAYKKDSFAKALSRNPSKVQTVDSAVAVIVVGGTVDDPKLQAACADALKHFHPK